MTGATDEGDDLSAATREAATHARRRARQEVPTPDDLAGLIVAAGRRDLSRAEIRRLAAAALGNMQQISFFLGRLAELGDEEQRP